MKAKHLLLPVFAVLILINSCRKAEPGNDNDCVKKYQDRMAKIKEDKEAAIQKCQNGGGTGVADCVATVTSESEKLEKAALEEFQACVNNNHK